MCMKKKKNEKTENQKGIKKKHFWKESLCRGSIACFSLSVLSRSFRYDTSHATALAFKARVRLQLALGEKEARLRHKAVPFSLVFRICFFFQAAAAACGLEPSTFRNMANSNPASPLACLLDLTYRSAEAENDAGVVSALKEKVKRLLPSAAAQKSWRESIALLERGALDFFKNAIDKKKRHAIETCLASRLLSFF